LRKKDQSSPTASIITDVEKGIVMSGIKSKDVPNHLWIADSGAICHVAFNGIGV
jgi:hypothetical protein